MRVLDDCRFRHRHEVKPMSRFLKTPLALLAGLVLSIAGCSGESPTGPKTDGGSGGGTTPCNAAVSLNAFPANTYAGTAVLIRANVTVSGKAVPDGTSVLFTADFGVFPDSGLPSISKVTQNGYADVYYGATTAGIGNVTATYTCASAKTTIQFETIPAQGPYVSSMSPTVGSCAGGETVVINGGRFTGKDATKLVVTFGGSLAAIQVQSDTSITVLTPARTLASGQVSEVVDVVVVVDANTAFQVKTAAKRFTYSCPQSQAPYVSSVTPTTGSCAGGETVTISGGRFAGKDTTKLKVTFGGSTSTIVSQTDTTISVLTPARVLASGATSEVVDLVVTVDAGTVFQAAAAAAKFTYSCPQSQAPYVSSVTPTTGSCAGGETVTISGGRFAGKDTTKLKVTFGGSTSTIVSQTDTTISVLTPARTLASGVSSEIVDVVVTVDEKRRAFRRRPY